MCGVPAPYTVILDSRVIVNWVAGAPPPTPGRGIIHLFQRRIHESLFSLKWSRVRSELLILHKIPICGSLLVAVSGTTSDNSIISETLEIV